jgi:hypothetical protein
MSPEADGCDVIRSGLESLEGIGYSSGYGSFTNDVTILTVFHTLVHLFSPHFVVFNANCVTYIQEQLGFEENGKID